MEVGDTEAAMVEDTEAAKVEEGATVDVKTGMMTGTVAAAAAVVQGGAVRGNPTLVLSTLQYSGNFSPSFILQSSTNKRPSLQPRAVRCNINSIPKTFCAAKIAYRI